jgi:hypothetical protein
MLRNNNKSELASLTISAIGDLSFSGEFVEENRGSIVSKEIVNLLRSDLLIGNLECAISPTEEKYDSDNLLLKSSKDIIDVIKSLDMKVLTLANNHFSDAGPDGMLYTMRLLKENDIGYCGAGETIEEALEPAIFTINDITVGVFSCMSTKYFLNEGQMIATMNSPGIAPFRLDLLEKVMEKYSSSLDYKVLCIHWGIQDIQFPSPFEKSISKNIINSGFNLILGHHPHVVQSYGQYKNSGIMFSLGNFYFHPIYHAGELFYGFAKKYYRNRRGIIFKCNLLKQNGVITSKYSSINTFQSKDNIVVKYNNIFYRLKRSVFNLITFSPINNAMFHINYYWNTNKEIIHWPSYLLRRIKKMGVGYYLTWDILNRIINRASKRGTLNSYLKEVEISNNENKNKNE